jgi:hypothetical protein
MNPASASRRDTTRPAARLAYFCRKFPRGLSPRAYQTLLMRRPELRSLGWVLKRRPIREQSAAIAAAQAAAKLGPRKPVDVESWPHAPIKA